jgi:predicted metal-dependent HD superfamily phosphohydrolase
LYEKLIAAYSEQHRRYHTLQHLEECFARFDELADLAEHPKDVELAIWFHDAIYDPRRDDMATRHEAMPQTRDEEALIDVDLWILGAPQARFDDYEKQVREEYRWVPGLIYRRKRREILESFVARPTIYSTERFIQRYEAQARANLARSLARR